MTTLRLPILLALLPLAGTAAAHHSFTATYDESREVSIEGTLVQFMYRNPHAFVHVIAPDENGDMIRWAIEWGAAGTLDRQGVKRETLKAGDRVIITGNPGRNPIDHRIRMQTLTRPADNFTWGTREGEDFD